MDEQLVMRPCFPKRVKYGAASPAFGWFVSYIRVIGFAADRTAIEERVIKIRLPVWGLGYEICSDSERWGQRVLAWYGCSGFKLGWAFD